MEMIEKVKKDYEQDRLEDSASGGEIIHKRRYIYAEKRITNSRRWQVHYGRDSHVSVSQGGLQRPGDSTEHHLPEPMLQGAVLRVILHLQGRAQAVEAGEQDIYEGPRLEGQSAAGGAEEKEPRRVDC